MGQQIDALELIGYDPETDTFPATVSPGQGDHHGVARPAGRDVHWIRGEDGTFSGGWRPHSGADET